MVPAKEMIPDAAVEFPTAKPPWMLVVLVAEARLGSSGRKLHEWFGLLHDGGGDGDESEEQKTSLQAMPKDRSSTEPLR